MGDSGSGKWQLAFWIITSLFVLTQGLNVKGYFFLDNKIASAEERLHKEKKEDITNIEDKIQHIQDKLESQINKTQDKLEKKIDESVKEIKNEQKEFRLEQKDVNQAILGKLEEIKNK